MATATSGLAPVRAPPKSLLASSEPVADDVRTDESTEGPMGAKSWTSGLHPSSAMSSISSGVTWISLQAATHIPTPGA
jgi:hypothetical protein